MNVPPRKLWTKCPTCKRRVPLLGVHSRFLVGRWHAHGYVGEHVRGGGELCTASNALVDLEAELPFRPALAVVR